MRLTYNPTIFDVADEDAARQIILTPDPDQDTATRWERETPYFGGLAQAFLAPGPEDVVVDFGCGIGRLSRELIARSGCRVLGVDISESMRRLAVDYVASDRFEAVSPETFSARVASGLRIGGALAIWVLQHCLRPLDAVSVLRDALSAEARLLVVNTHQRCVPVHEAPWADDELKIRTMLAETLRQTAIGELDGRFVSPITQRSAFWGVYAKRDHDTPR